MNTLSNLKKIEWSNSRKSIDDIFPANYNPRKITDEQAAQLKESLDKFQLADPIIINTDNKIIGGHQRYYILKQSGETQVDVRVPDRALTDDEERELNLRLNKNTGEWNLDLLKDFDKDLLADVGFTSAELDAIFPIEASEQDDVVPEPPEEPVTQRGDIWQLGRHRVMCGDSTDAGSVALLMDGKKASLVFSDPPYGISYDGGFGSEREDKYKDDFKDYRLFLTQIYKNAFDVSDDKSPLMIWYASKKTLDVLLAIADIGYELREILIWNKPNAHYGALMCQYKIRYEPCIYAYKKGKSPRFFGDSTQRNLVDVAQPTKNDLHPTMKPVELYEMFIPNHCERDGIVFEPFGGSGTTIIACEKTSRICYGMEIDPKYCDVIVKRWEDFTGQKAELSNGKNGAKRADEIHA
jgi:ParB family chromosome partitioning protein